MVVDASKQADSDKEQAMIGGKPRHLLLGTVAALGITSVAHAQMPPPCASAAAQRAVYRRRSAFELVTKSTSDQRHRHGGKRVAAISFRVGWYRQHRLGLARWYRVEIEGDYRNNQFAHGLNFGFPARAGGREIKRHGPMVNVLYDMTNLLAQTTGLTVPYFAPYIGVGVGYQWAHQSGFTASGTTRTPVSPRMTPTVRLRISSSSVARCPYRRCVAWR